MDTPTSQQSPQFPPPTRPPLVESRGVKPVWVAVIVVLAASAVVVSFFVGFATGRFSSVASLAHGTPTANAPAADPISSAPAAPTTSPSDYADKIQIVSASAAWGESGLGKRGAAVDLKVKNMGSKTVNDLVINVSFLDAHGQPICEDDIALASSNGFARDQAAIYDWDLSPIKPNYVRQRNGSMSLNVPAEWKAGAIVATVKSVSVE